jgi:hypothetical protein
MASLYRMLVGVSWGLGLLSMVLGVLLKLMPSLGERFNTSPHGGLVLAGVLFLCALATRDLERAV